jgi:hypothetical protein
MLGDVDFPYLPSGEKVKNKKDISTVQVIPSARRLISSLRDVGYDFVHAVADLVDNSLAAKATEVKINLSFDGPHSWLRIADNGFGMTGTDITEAMRYGSERDYEVDDLGKFGLGLKTASLSQCRSLSVASRTDPMRNRIEARRLDLDYIEEANSWEVHILGSSNRDDHLVEPLKDGPGTVVLWESLDRLLSYKLPWGERAKTSFYNLAEQLEEHLGMVFHRFLSGEIRQRRKVKIWINDNPVEAWDPFARGEKATEMLPSNDYEVSTSNGVGLIHFQPYVLPPRDRFSSEKAFNRMTGPAKWNAQQGFYVYRANRMIQSGGWCRMRTVDEHSKLARGSLDFFPDLDSAFEVNVAKVRVSLPGHLRERLRNPVDAWVSRAVQVYRQSARAEKEGVSSLAPSSSKAGQRAALGGSGNTPAMQLVEPRETTQLNFRGALEAAAAEVNQENALAEIVNALKAGQPEVARALGWR